MLTKFKRLLSKSLTTLEVMMYDLVVHTGPGQSVFGLTNSCSSLVSARRAVCIPSGSKTPVWRASLVSVSVHALANSKYMLWKCAHISLFYFYFILFFYRFVNKKGPFDDRWSACPGCIWTNVSKIWSQLSTGVSFAVGEVLMVVQCDWVCRKINVRKKEKSDLFGFFVVVVFVVWSLPWQLCMTHFSVTDLGQSSVEWNVAVSAGPE